MGPSSPSRCHRLNVASPRSCKTALPFLIAAYVFFCYSVLHFEVRIVLPYIFCLILRLSTLKFALTLPHLSIIFTLPLCCMSLPYFFSPRILFYCIFVTATYIVTTSTLKFAFLLPRLSNFHFLLPRPDHSNFVASSFCSLSGSWDTSNIGKEGGIAIAEALKVNRTITEIQ